MRTFKIFLASIFLILGSLPSFAHQTQPSPDHSNYDQGPLPKGSLAWTYKASNGIIGSMSESGGKLFFCDGGGRVYCLEKENGRANWIAQFEAMVYGAPVISGDRLFVGSGDGNVFALDANTGNMVWSKSISGSFQDPQTPGPVSSINSSLALYRNRLFVPSLDGSLSCLDSSDGRTIWKFRAKRGIQSSPIVVPPFIFIGDQAGGFHALDIGTGERKWGGSAGGPIDTSPSWSDGTVYYGGWDGVVHAVRVKSVVPLWSVKGEGAVVTDIALNSKGLYWATALGKLYGASKENGEILWTKEIGTSFGASPAATDKALFVPNGKKVLSLDPLTGESRVMYEVKGVITSSLLLSEGTLFLGTDDGTVYGIK